MLEQESRYFEEHKDELLKNHEGQFVLVKGDRLIGAFTKAEEAFERGVGLFGDVPFLIKLVSKEEKKESLSALTLGLIHAPLSREDALELMIAEAQKMPGLVDIMKVYGDLAEAIRKSDEYMNSYKAKPISTLSNGSA